MLLAQVTGRHFDDEALFAKAAVELEDFRAQQGPLVFAVGECADADPFELALTLVRAGFQVAEIFGTVGDGNAVLIRRLAETSPDTRIYSNLSPSMLAYRPWTGEVVCAIGQDARWYHPECAGTEWQAGRQPFGMPGLHGFWPSSMRRWAEHFAYSGPDGGKACAFAAPSCL